MNPMSKLMLAIACACVGACADEPDGCDLGDRFGTYLVSNIEISGDCGPIAPQVIYISNTLDPECHLLANDHVSSDECTLGRSIECVYGIQTVRASGFTKDHGGADFIEGTITIEIYEGTGLVCASTYDVEYERQ